MSERVRRVLRGSMADVSVALACWLAQPFLQHIGIWMCRVTTYSILLYSTSLRVRYPPAYCTFSTSSDYLYPVRVNGCRHVFEDVGCTFRSDSGT